MGFVGKKGKATIIHRLSTSAGNHLLASLPAEAKEEILHKLTPIILENRSQLYWAEQPIEHVYFVGAGMISIVCTLESGMQAEVGVVGREGVLGASVLSGIGVAFFDAMVQLPGAALRMSVRDFQNKNRDLCATEASSSTLQRDTIVSQHVV